MVMRNIATGKHTQILNRYSSNALGTVSLLEVQNTLVPCMISLVESQ